MEFDWLIGAYNRINGLFTASVGEMNLESKTRWDLKERSVFYTRTRVILGWEGYSGRKGGPTTGMEARRMGCVWLCEGCIYGRCM